MFFVVVLVVMTVLYGYVGMRMVAPFDISGSWSLVYYLVIALIGALPILGLLLGGRSNESPVTDQMISIGYFGMGLFSLAFIIFILRDLGWVSGSLLGKMQALFSKASGAPAELDTGRRQFLLTTMNWSILGLTTLLGASGLIMARGKPRVIKQDIALAGLPEVFKGFRIAQISDLHVGPNIKADFVQQVVDQVNALDVDMVFFTGDMVDGSVEHLWDDVEPLRQLRSRYGTFFVTGNHEYYSGADAWVAKASELGMRVLMNEHEIITRDGRSLAIAGIPDLTAHQMNRKHRSDPAKALQGIPQGIPIIMLAHQPGSAYQLDDLGVDLMVCGHTHGGQYMPFNLAVKMVHEYPAGHYTRGRMQIYVNRGTGFWGPPLRLGVPSEITHFELI